MFEYVCPLCGARYAVEHASYSTFFQYKDKKIKSHGYLHEGDPCYKCEDRLEKARKEAEKAIIAEIRK